MAKNMGGSCFFSMFVFGFGDRFRVGFGALLGAEHGPKSAKTAPRSILKIFFGLFLTVKRKHFYRHEVVDFWAPLGRWLLDDISLQHMVLFKTFFIGCLIPFYWPCFSPLILWVWDRLFKLSWVDF